jgi:cellulose synthase/poly-beta-1,6-N-acetylglucosamine synthase-like glycosyltransferase
MGDNSKGRDQVKSVSVIVVSKDEPALADTLDALAEQVALTSPALVPRVEVVVVDASAGRLDAIRAARPWAHWVDFARVEGVRVSIPHQRNRGVRDAEGDVIVFTDCGCIPQGRWLESLLSPILSGDERVTCGRAKATGPVDPYDRSAKQHFPHRYIPECSTINLAIRRDVFDQVGYFDETFQYGSDTDFSWRVVHNGYRIRYVAEAVVYHDWGTRRRQVRRSYAYGKARARLYRKHMLGAGAGSTSKRHLNEHDVVSIVYPAYLLGLPIVWRHRSYLLLLLIPLWRSRHDQPVQTLVDHLVLGAGVLVEAWEMAREAEA